MSGRERPYITGHKTGHLPGHHFLKYLIRGCGTMKLMGRARGHLRANLPPGARGAHVHALLAPTRGAGWRAAAAHDATSLALPARPRGARPRPPSGLRCATRSAQTAAAAARGVPRVLGNARQATIAVLQPWAQPGMACGARAPRWGRCAAAPSAARGRRARLSGSIRGVQPAAAQFRAPGPLGRPAELIHAPAPLQPGEPRRPGRRAAGTGALRWLRPHR